MKVKSLSHVRLLATPWTAAPRLLRPWDSPGKSTGGGATESVLMSKLDGIVYIKDPIPKPWWCNRIGLAGLLLRGHLKLEGVGVF